MTRLFRVRFLLVAAAAFVVLPAGPASAHVAGGQEPSNYSAEITSISPPMPGVRVVVSADGDELQMHNDSDVEVVVPGYSDEPYLRITADGVQRNDRSPATYLNATAAGDSALPPRADPEAEPDWVTVSAAPSFGWHDHRTHWMGAGLPPEVQADPSRAHLVSSWQVPVLYGEQRVLVSGTLTWTPPQSSLPWAMLVVGLVVAAVALGGRPHWQRPMLALLVTAVAAEVLHLALSPLPEDAPVFSTVAGALPAVAALLLTGASGRSLRAGTSTIGFPAGIAAVLVLVTGLSDVSVLWNSQLPSAGPGWLTRLIVSVGVGLGAGVGLGCLRTIARSREPARAAPAAAAAP